MELCIKHMTTRYTKQHLSSGLENGIKEWVNLRSK